MSDEKDKKGFWGLFRSKSSAIRNGKLVSEHGCLVDEDVLIIRD